MAQQLDGVLFQVKFRSAPGIPAHAVRNFIVAAKQLPASGTVGFFQAAVAVLDKSGALTDANNSLAVDIDHLQRIHVIIEDSSAVAKMYEDENWICIDQDKMPA
ncbi:MAG: hypothetical protein BGO12_00990 [Verrucomicrobia bacterium 61-8]|nr:hypothetical protein [Verrucomicrobiota bacterium]OJV20906.1 MAG: hypothetical protein BGO12_00990 [Verrucomicrobia bacterium 61-8]